MNNAQAFMMGQIHQNDPHMVFDWDRAAKRILESKAAVASAGLRSDWEYTGGTIYEDGKPVTDSYTYLCSTWAVPELELDGVLEPCWRYMEGSGWNEDTKWPQSALDILSGKTIFVEAIESSKLLDSRSEV